MGTKKLLKRYFTGRDIYFVLVCICIGISALMLWDASSDNSYVLSEYANPTAEQISDVSDSSISMLVFCIVAGAGGGIFKEMFGLSIQNGVSRRSFIKAYGIFMLTWTAVISVVVLICQLVLNSIFEYQKTTTLIADIILDIKGIGGVNYLWSLAEDFACGITASALSAVIYMIFSRYKAWKIGFVGSVMLAIVVIGVVTTVVYKAWFAVCVIIGVLLAALFVSFFALARKLSPEYEFDLS